eukprot:TRINITY_DN466_c0_g1_i6.p1 TRINITY_DN466_c0_g1~~TRINITY_DN466_c0_g1_i6.p1  ORF type:complete len:951 (-),score=204.72 TRINITY_DN466_c0_g1_i6:76-2892(-)
MDTDRSNSREARDEEDKVRHWDRKRRRSTSPARRRSSPYGRGGGSYSGGFYDYGAKETTNRPCTFFQQGHCSKGDCCDFLHVMLDDLPKIGVCKFYFMHKCRNGSRCTYSHQLSKRDLDYLPTHKPKMMANTNDRSPPRHRRDTYCELCDCPIGDQTYSQHCGGKQHMQALQQFQSRKDREKDEIRQRGYSPVRERDHKYRESSEAKDAGQSTPAATSDGRARLAAAAPTPAAKISSSPLEDGELIDTRSGHLSRSMERSPSSHHSERDVCDRHRSKERERDTESGLARSQSRERDPDRKTAGSSARTNADKPSATNCGSAVAEDHSRDAYRWPVAQRTLVWVEDEVRRRFGNTMRRGVMAEAITEHLWRYYLQDYRKAFRYLDALRDHLNDLPVATNLSVELIRSIAANTEPAAHLSRHTSHQIDVFVEELKTQEAAKLQNDNTTVADKDKLHTADTMCVSTQQQRYDDTGAIPNHACVSAEAPAPELVNTSAKQAPAFDVHQNPLAPVLGAPPTSPVLEDEDEEPHAQQEFNRKRAAYDSAVTPQKRLKLEPTEPQEQPAAFMTYATNDEGAASDAEDDSVLRPFGKQRRALQEKEREVRALRTQVLSLRAVLTSATTAGAALENNLISEAAQWQQKAAARLHDCLAEGTRAMEATVGAALGAAQEQLLLQVEAGVQRCVVAECDSTAAKLADLQKRLAEAEPAQRRQLEDIEAQHRAVEREERDNLKKLEWRLDHDEEVLTRKLETARSRLATYEHKRQMLAKEAAQLRRAPTTGAIISVVEKADKASQAQAPCADCARLHTAAAQLQEQLAQLRQRQQAEEAAAAAVSQVIETALPASGVATLVVRNSFPPQQQEQEQKQEKQEQQQEKRDQQQEEQQQEGQQQEEQEKREQEQEQEQEHEHEHEQEQREQEQDHEQEQEQEQQQEHKEHPQQQ